MMGRLVEEKVFKDPVHKYIYVQDEIIWQLINTREFQRLRRIRQLGTTYLTFHGAEHSRFSHSLGVYEITRKIISQFERNGYTDWPQEEKLVSLCAALLHDLGHGPFSHSIEEIFDTHHEQWTCRFLLEDSEVNRVLRSVAPDFPERVASVICKTYDKPIVMSLVSSQMDADRMDYLLRDAYYTGVNYGMFDLERILRVLRPYKGKIVVKESGMHAVEDYLMSRYQMYWQVYFHPVTRSSEIILRQIFHRAKTLYREGVRLAFLPEPFKQLFAGEMSLEAYFTLDEALAQMTIMQWMKEGDALLSELSGRFIGRRLYKYIAMDERDEPLWERVRAAFAHIGLNPEYHLAIDFPVDLPYDVYRPEQSNVVEETDEKPPILLLCQEDRLVEMSRKSDIVRSITGQQLGKYHLYYPADLLEGRWQELPPEVRRLLNGTGDTGDSAAR